MSYKPTYKKRGAKQYTGKYQAQRAAARRRRAQSKFRQQSAPYVEKKGMDTVIDYDVIPATTNDNTFTTVLNLVPPGTGSWNRIGKRINPASVRIRGFLNYQENSDATAGSFVGTMVRLVVVYDKQPSGNAIPAFDDIFGYTEQDGTESSIPFSGVKFDNTDRFRVLKDDFIDINPTAMVHGGTTNRNNVIMYYDEFIKLPNTPTVYSGQSATQTIADISTGAIYFIARRENTSLGGSLYFDGLARLRYTD